MSELISVIVPVYNVEKYLSQCLDSIINQTYKNIEIILINDMSTDSSKEICEQYAKKDIRIRLINKSINSGVSDSRNLGIENCHGEYITFVDSDDYINDNFIEKLYEVAKNENADIVIAEYYRLLEEKGEFLIHTFDYYERVLTNNEIIDKIFIAENDTFVTPWGMLCKRNLFFENFKVRFPSGAVNEDQYVTYQLFIKLQKTIYINNSLYCYRKRDGSTTTKEISLKHIEDDLNGFQQRSFDLLLAGVHSEFEYDFYYNRFNIYKNLLEKNGNTSNATYTRLLKYMYLLNIKK